MNIVIHEENPDLTGAIQYFLKTVFERHMTYFASDLLAVGLSPSEIQEALQRSMLTAKNAGIPVYHHFHQQYTDFHGSIIRDCKLSRTGYALVLLNSNPSRDIVAKWQVQLVSQYLSHDGRNV